MTRRFEIADLRTLTARALQESDYRPAVSARVRAVPDTRTIRYYTTLGLLAPPRVMRGRTALYDEQHLLQIVAIKRLQAQDQTLSDIQKQLQGLPKEQLETIARLPESFWDDADAYLSDPKNFSKSTGNDDAGKATSTESQPFWLREPKLPKSPPQVQLTASESESLSTAIRLRFIGATISVELPHKETLSKTDLTKLREAAIPLIQELERQQLI